MLLEEHVMLMWIEQSNNSSYAIEWSCQKVRDCQNDGTQSYNIDDDIVKAELILTIVISYLCVNVCAIASTAAVTLVCMQSCCQFLVGEKLITHLSLILKHHVKHYSSTGEDENRFGLLLPMVSAEWLPHQKGFTIMFDFRRKIIIIIKHCQTPLIH